MFDTERFFSQIWAGWFFFLLISAFSLGVESLLVVPVTLFMLGLLCWCISCAYRTERFRSYAALRLFFGLGFVPAIGFLAALAATLKQLRLDVCTSLMISSAPLLVAVFTYAAVYSYPGKSILLHFRGGRAEILETSPSNHWYAGGVGAGLSGLLYPIFEAYSTSLMWIMFFLMFISVFLTVYHGSKIHALKALKHREAKDRRHYTFMNIEEIRAMRAKSLLGRIFTQKCRL